MRSIIRLLGSAKELWPYYAGIVACSLAVAATGLLTPFIIKAATDYVVAANQGQVSGISTVIWLAAALLVADLANTRRDRHPRAARHHRRHLRRAAHTASVGHQEGPQTPPTIRHPPLIAPGGTARDPRVLTLGRYTGSALRFVRSHPLSKGAC